MKENNNNSQNNNNNNNNNSNNKIDFPFGIYLEIRWCFPSNKKTQVETPSRRLRTTSEACFPIRYLQTPRILQTYSGGTEFGSPLWANPGQIFNLWCKESGQDFLARLLIFIFRGKWSGQWWKQGGQGDEQSG